jgi:WD40 repeat protein/HEAT repeat protein
MDGNWARLTVLAVLSIVTGLPAQDFPPAPVPVQPSVPDEPPDAWIDEATRPDFRLELEKTEHTDCYGDPLPKGAVGRLGTIRFRHASAVTCIAFSPDGKVLASVGDDGMLCLWDAATGKPLRRFREHDGKADLSRWRRLIQDDNFFHVAFSADGNTLVSATMNGSVRVWDTRTGKLRHNFIQPCRVSTHLGDYLLGAGAVALARDGTKLAALVNIPEGPVQRHGGSATGRIWDTRTGRRLASFGAKGDGLTGILFSPDGKVVVTGSGVSGTVSIWDAETGKLRRRFRVLGYSCRPMAFSLDGRALACLGGGRGIVLADFATGKEVRRFPEDDDRVESLAFSPDGKLLAAVGYTQRGVGGGYVHLWEASTGKLVRRFPMQYREVKSVAFSPNGKVLATGCCDRAIRLWNVATAEPVHDTDGDQSQVRVLAFSPDGTILAAMDWTGVVRLWDVASKRELRRLDGQKWGTAHMAFSPDSKTLAVAPWGQSPILLWDVATGKRRREYSSHIFHAGLAYLPDTRLIHWGQEYKDGSPVDATRVLDTATGKEGAIKLRGPYPHFSADGRRYAVTADPGVRLFDTITGKERCWSREQGMKGVLIALAPDGRTGASGYQVGDSVVVYLWETSKGRLLYDLHIRDGSPQCLAFSPDCATVAALGGGNIHLWEVATGTERQRIEHHSAHFAFSPDGRTLASTEDLATNILLWDLTGAGRIPKGKTATRTRQELNAAWDDLAATSAATAQRAIGSLVAAPGQAVPFLRERLRPPPRPDVAKIARWIADFDSDQFAVRKQATDELAKLEEAAEPALRRALAGRQSAEAKRRTRQLLEKVQHLRESPPPPDRLRLLRALQVLEFIGTAEARQLLEAYAQGPPESAMTPTAKLALACLARQAGARQHSIPAKAKDRDKSGMRAAPLFQGKTVQEWTDLLKDEDETVRLRAAKTLGRLGTAGEKAIQALTKTIKDKDAQVRVAAIIALELHGPAAKTAVPELIKALDGKDEYRPDPAVDALASIGAAAVPALIEALSAESPILRNKIVLILSRIGPPAKTATTALGKLLRTELDSMVRQHAAYALGMIGPGAKAAIPALRAALCDADDAVKWRALEALEAISK